MFLPDEVALAEIPGTLAVSEPQTAATPIRSMTGFAQVRAKTDAGELTLSLRGVNHRGLDLHFQWSSEFSPFEAALRATLKERVARGHIEIRMALARDPDAQAVFYNREALARYVNSFRQARAEFGLAGEPDLNVLLTLPGVLGSSAETKPIGKELEPQLLAALEACISQFNEGREREGRVLGSSIERELNGIEQAVSELAALRANALAHYHRKLLEKLGELLAGAQISESRLAEEAALLAERSDVEEELTRLGAHARELRRIVEGGGAIGKPLDFLLQEMNREANTTLSKSSGAGDLGLKIGNLALGVKASIERMREQALNLE